MDAAELHFGLWIDRLNGLRKPFQAGDTGDQDILDFAVVRVREHIEPIA